MDIRALTTFVAAYEEASFSKAAQRLNATQPGVSVQIAALEEALDTPLFERRARGVQPTTAGKKLYIRALQLIHDVKSAELEIRSLAGVVSGEIAVGIPPTLSKAVLAPILSRYVASYPDVEIRIFEAYSDTLLSLVESRELDFAFVARLPDHPAISYRKIYRDRFVLASSTRLDLPPGVAIHLDVEPHFKLVVPSLLRHGLYRLLEEPLRTRRIIPARVIEIDGLAGALEFISMTDWVALLPAAAAYNNPDAAHVRFNPIAGEEINIDYFVAHTRIEPISMAGQAFIDLTCLELDRVAEQWQSRL